MDAEVSVKQESKPELTDNARKKRKHTEPIDYTNCLKHMTDALNKPSSETLNNASPFFDKENKRPKKELSGSEKVGIFNVKKSIWKEIRSS